MMLLGPSAAVAATFSISPRCALWSIRRAKRASRASRLRRADLDAGRGAVETYSELDIPACWAVRSTGITALSGSGGDGVFGTDIEA